MTNVERLLAVGSEALSPSPNSFPELFRGYPLGSDLYHLLEAGKRLMPKTPFFLGGEYILENLWAGDPLEGMRFKADVAMQTRDLPDGAQVRLKVAAKPPATDRS